MSFCDTCELEEKIYQCCARHPLSFATRTIIDSNGKMHTCCNELDETGTCTDYRNRPDGCRDFICDSFKTDKNNFLKFITV